MLQSTCSICHWSHSSDCWRKGRPAMKMQDNGCQHSCSQASHNKVVVEPFCQQPSGMSAGPFQLTVAVVIFSKDGWIFLRTCTPRIERRKCFKSSLETYSASGWNSFLRSEVWTIPWKSCFNVPFFGNAKKGTLKHVSQKIKPFCRLASTKAPWATIGPEQQCHALEALRNWGSRAHVQQDNDAASNKALSHS